MLIRARLDVSSPPRPAGRPEPMPYVVECARRLLVGERPGVRPSAAPLEAVVVGTRERPDSTIRIFELGEDTARRRFYLKTLRGTSSTRSARRHAIMTEHRILTRLREDFASLPHLTVVRPVACFPEELSLLTEEWPGRGLDTVLGGVRIGLARGRRAAAVEQCRLGGEWLKRFQLFTAPGEPAVFELAELFAYCEERLKMIADAPDDRLDRDTAGAVLRRLERVGAEVDRSELAAVGRHNDFRPENMLTDGSRLAVLDFTGFTHGPRLYDFMKFWLKLEDVGSSPFGRRRAVADLQAAFVDGYGAAINPRSPLALLIRAAFVLDKISEAVDPDLPRPPLGRRVVLNHWYRRQRRWLLHFTQGRHPI